MKEKILKILLQPLCLCKFCSEEHIVNGLASEIESLIKKDYVTMEEYILMRDDRNNTVKALKKLAKILEIINEES